MPPQDEAASSDKEQSQMKRISWPLTALVLVATGYSLHAGRLLRSEPPQSEVRAVSDPYASDAALRHRAAQPNHWRSMLLVK
jgi:hypothetical protein